MQDKTRESGAFSHLQKCKKFYTPEYEIFYTFLFEKIFLINLKNSLTNHSPASILRVEATNSIKITTC